MKISIIIPTYNCGQYIRKAINSVLDQSYSNKELIVIDGGSKDNTLEILKSYGEKIKWISEKDKGQADAVNKGFKVATGEIMTWLNADDYYEHDIFREVADSFIKNKEVVLLYGKCFSVFPDKKITNTPPSKINYKKMLRRGNYIYQPASFYRTETIKKINYLDEKLNYWMEYDLFIKLLKEGESLYMDKVLSNFTVRADQKSNLKNKKEMDREIFKISRKYGGSYFSKLFLRTILNKISK